MPYISQSLLSCLQENSKVLLGLYKKDPDLCHRFCPASLIEKDVHEAGRLLSEMGADLPDMESLRAISARIEQAHQHLNLGRTGSAHAVLLSLSRVLPPPLSRHMQDANAVFRGETAK